jgi:hypothetical protein
MTSDTTFSFVYNQQSVDTAFHGIAPRELTLSMLAALTPEKEWEGCLVYQGPSPLGAGSICIATGGPGASEVQLRLLEAFESHGVKILQVFEGGPEASESIAVARNGLWAQP